MTTMDTRPDQSAVRPGLPLIALGFGLVCRFMIGGAGMMTGLVGLGMAYVISVAWISFARKRIKSAFIQDISLGVVDTLSLLALFLLPFSLALQITISIAPTLLISNVIGIIAIGFVLRHEKSYLAEARLLQEHATTDQLTQLLNRRGLEVGIDEARFDPLLGHAVLYFDIDNFKQINDTHGHDIGDAALAILAARLRDIIRGDAVFARHGGDEFSVYFPGIGAEAIQAVADRMVSAISDQDFSHGATTFSVSISVGGYWSKQERTHDFMIKTADTQLLLAKQAGKNRAQIAYDHDDRLSVVA